MGIQISIYYTYGYLFSYPLRARDGIYSGVPVGMGILATPRHVNGGVGTSFTFPISIANSYTLTRTLYITIGDKKN